VTSLVYVEDESSLRAVTLARSLGAPVAAVTFGARGSDGTPSPIGGQQCSIAALHVALGAHGVSDIYEISGLEAYAPQAYGRTLARLAEETGAAAVLAAGDDHGNEVLAHVGAITGYPMAANVVAVSPGEPLSLTRQRWAGLLLEDAVLDAPVALLTVATDAVAAEPADVAIEPEVHHVEADVTADDLLVRATESAAGAGGASLATARVVVGGGRGVGGADGFAPLEELAALLGGVVGVSRVVTSEGWRPHTMQVGQTGTKITPELYLACGISGAIQHIAGCSGAKHIIAVNTDPAAPILSRAEYVVIGDLHRVIPELVDAIKSR